LLNIGCGDDILDGWINADISLPCDMQADVSYLPFKTGSLDKIKASHILEHVQDLVHAQRELARVLKEGGELEVIVPHYQSVDAWGDPTHCRAFSEMSFVDDFWHGFQMTSVGIQYLTKVFLLSPSKWLKANFVRTSEPWEEVNMFARNCKVK
jgi:SAM-dependent methyltransferase